jgi:hypothetical protein
MENCANDRQRRRLSANVLIEGETGTGRRAGRCRCLHDFSRRCHPFVALNCGGLPENLFESEIFGHEANAFTGAGKRGIGKIGTPTMAARCSSMKWKHADQPADQTCCVHCRNAPWNAWARTRAGRWIAG